MSGQSKRASAAEALAGTAIGFGVSWAATPPILALFGYQASAGTAFGITVIYTVLSVVRGYLVRRLFNHLHTRPKPEPDPKPEPPHELADRFREVSESCDIAKNWWNPAVREAWADWNRRRLDGRGHLPARDCDP